MKKKQGKGKKLSKTTKVAVKKVKAKIKATERKVVKAFKKATKTSAKKEVAKTITAAQRLKKKAVKEIERVANRVKKTEEQVALRLINNAKVEVAVVKKKSAAAATRVKKALESVAQEVEKQIGIVSTPKNPARIGVLGGSFNPIHVGHMNAALSAKQELRLDKVLVVPNAQPPHRSLIGPAADERIAMIQKAIAPYSEDLVCDTREVDRGGVSYTFETLRDLGREYDPANIYFIMGADAFAEFHTWKNFEELLSLANFVIVSRPGFPISLAAADLPSGLHKFIKASDEKHAILSTGRTIELVRLQDVDTASTEVRKKLRNNGDVSRDLPPAVIQHIESKGLYKRTSPLVADYKKFAFFCSERALDKKALGLKIYDLSGSSSYTDYTVICSATSSKHASAIADGILQTVKDEYGLLPLSYEGAREGRWVLIDFGAVVVHVFDDTVRGHYNIEKMWKNCAQLQSELTVPAGTGRPESNA